MPVRLAVYHQHKRKSPVPYILLLCLLAIRALDHPVRAQEQAALRTTVTASDSARINTLIKNANRYLITDPDSTITLLKEPWEQSLALNYAYGCGKVMGNMATAYRNKGALHKSLELYHKAIFFF